VACASGSASANGINTPTRRTRVSCCARVAPLQRPPAGRSVINITDGAVAACYCPRRGTLFLCGISQMRRREFITARPGRCRAAEKRWRACAALSPPVLLTEFLIGLYPSPSCARRGVLMRRRDGETGCGSRGRGSKSLAGGRRWSAGRANTLRRNPAKFGLFAMWSTLCVPALCTTRKRLRFWSASVGGQPADNAALAQGAHVAHHHGLFVPISGGNPCRACSAHSRAHCLRSRF
jgi:hypothetical protein